MSKSLPGDAAFQIRWMIRRDMEEVLKIEAENFGSPWSEDDFIRCLRARNSIGMVAELDGRVVGFMVHEFHKTRLGVLNFAVDKGRQRRGIGTLMIGKLIEKLSPHRRTRITLEVCEANLAAQCFFRSQGFRAVNVLRDFYEDTTEDAYRMVYRLRSIASSGRQAAEAGVAP